MGIRIDYIPYGTMPVVRVAGRLTSRATEQLKKVCHPIKASFIIDLSDLVYADEEGISAIREIVDGGVQVQGASPFVKLLINSHQSVNRDT